MRFVSRLAALNPRPCRAAAGRGFIVRPLP
jgi:hypothetical protein